MNVWTRRRDQPARADLLRRINRTRILGEIRRAPGISRRQLAWLTGLTDASLSRIARNLIDEGFVTEAEVASGRVTRGRPNVGLWLNPHGVYIVAICLSAYEHKFSVVGPLGNRFLEGDIPGLPGSSDEEIASFVAAQIDAFRNRPDINPDRLGGVAVSIAGTINNRDRIVSAPMLGWEATPLQDCLSRALKLPAHVESVANALHMAEARSDGGRDYSYSLLVHSGLGLGASLMIDGQLSRGAGDEELIRHIVVGRRPETSSGASWLRLMDVASGDAILGRLRHARDLAGVAISDSGLRSGLPHAIRQANAGEPTAVAAFSEAGRQLAMSLVATAALVGPERIILAGPLAAAIPFAKSFKEAMDASFNSSPGFRANVTLSNCSYLRATEVMGLETLLFATGAPPSSGQSVVD